MVDSGWQVEYHGQNHYIGQYHIVNISFIVPTVSESHMFHSDGVDIVGVKYY